MLSRRQKQTLEFIRRFMSEEGIAPSYVEIAAGLRITSVSTVHKHLAALQRQGYLKRRLGARRGLELLNPESAMRRSRRLIGLSHRLPLLGRIAAGRPIEAIETRDTVGLADLARGKRLFALEVKGDSMIDEHIVEGDYVLVEPAERVENGAIAVVLVDGEEATLKRWYWDRGKVRLQPANQRMEALRYKPDRVRVRGRVVGVLRKY